MVSYDAGHLRARLDGLKKKTRSFTVIFFDEATVSKNRSELIREYAAEDWYKVCALRSICELLRITYCKSNNKAKTSVKTQILRFNDKTELTENKITRTE